MLRIDRSDYWTSTFCIRVLLFTPADRLGDLQIDLDLITTGAGQQQRRMRGDLKREVSHLTCIYNR